MAFCASLIMDSLNEIPRSKSCLPGRKLPPVPNVVASPVYHLKRQNSKKCQNTLLQEYSIFEEYLLVQKAQIPGLYVMPSSTSPLVWNGVMFVKSGHYCGATFRFKLELPADFPSEKTPVLTFTPSIYHPMVHLESGVLDLGKGFTPWQQKVHQVWHLLFQLTTIFTNPNGSMPANPEASDDLNNDLPAFKSKVEHCLNDCSRRLLEDPQRSEQEEEEEEDESILRFSELDEETLKRVKEDVLRGPEVCF